MAKPEDENGKIFVGGLSWETTEVSLKDYFKHFGEVTEATIMRNTTTNKPRGFGFVTFKDPDCVTIVLCTGPHELDGRTIDPKACSTRQASKVNRRSTYSPKVFLGGLSANTTETDLRNFFSKYGKVGHIVIMYDQEKKKSKGFGFLAFESEESVARVCSEQYFNIKGKKVEAKRAEPREKSQTSQSNSDNGQAVASIPPNNWGMMPGAWNPNMPMGPMAACPMPNGITGAPGFQGNWGAQGAYGNPGFAYPGNWGGFNPGWGPQYNFNMGPAGAAPGTYSYPGYGPMAQATVGGPPAGGPIHSTPSSVGGPVAMVPLAQPSNQGTPAQTPSQSTPNAGGPYTNSPAGPTPTGLGTNYNQGPSSYGPQRNNFNGTYNANLPMPQGMLPSTS